MTAKLLDVIAKSWTDEDYKQRLMADPRAVLAEDGIEVPADATIRVVDQRPDEWYLFLPPRPKAEINVSNVTSQVAASAGLTQPRASHTTNMTIAAAARMTHHGCTPHTADMTICFAPRTCVPHTADMTICLARTAGMTDRQCVPHTADMTICFARPAALTEHGCAPHTAAMTDDNCFPHTAGMTDINCLPRTAALTLLTIPPAAPGSGGTGGSSGGEGGGQ
ncbi:hypothetical protein SBA4_230002 [Candidatus Sulfopaludibacter sp. SbA4]|nr:hypothetical protein SBA4_230002 [Candidatus Sulfopaludibacter sp. SbA4]